MEVEETSGRIIILEKGKDDEDEDVKYKEIMKSSSGKKISFFTNIIESKRMNFEKKLVEQFSELEREIVELEQKIKFNHESLAIEIGNFNDLKIFFWEHTAKLFVEEHLREVKFSQQVCEKALGDIKRMRI